MNINVRILILSFWVLVLSSCKSGKMDPIKEEGPPNVVLILVDDMGYSDVGFNGCKDIPTPNIDMIASQGVVFTNGYVTYAVCGPSRAGIITGRYQDRFGFSRNPLFAPKDPNMGLPQEESTMAEILSQAGYKSAAIGKWHLGAHPSQRPLKRGFTDFFGFLTGGHRYFPEEWTLQDENAVNSQFDAYRTKLLRNDQRIEEKEYLTDALSREAVNYIEKYKNDPFFIYLAYNAPHAPLQATEKYLSRFGHIEDEKRKVYAAMVSSVDDGVGLVLQKLEELKLVENTMVVFLSDNGGPEKTNGSDNGPLKGQKGDLWEGGIRVPFAIRWPAKISPGITYNEPIISLDILATIVAQNKGKIKLNKPLDGVNLLPYLDNDSIGVPHKELFWRVFDQKNYAVRMGSHKLVSEKESNFLFNLEKDLGEKNHVVNPEINPELQSRYQEWIKEMKDPVFFGLMQNAEYNRLHPDRFEKNNNE